MKEPLSQGERKLHNQLQKFSETETFQSAVQQIRNDAGIPPRGFVLTLEDRKCLADAFYLPQVIKKGDEKRRMIKTINIGTNPLMKILGVSTLYYRILFKNYVCFGDFFHEEISNSLPRAYYDDQCQLVDAREELYEIVPENEEDPDMEHIYVEQIRRSAGQHPIMIRIRPDASQRDILDFIKRNGERIRILQEKYQNDIGLGVKHGKTRSNQKIRSRNNFIYQNAKLPLKQIAILLRTNGFPVLDEGHIGKILSLENKRRNKSEVYE